MAGGATPSTEAIAASMNLVPVFGLAIALVVLHEGVGLLQVLGCVVVITGVLVAHRASSRVAVAHDGP